VVTCPLVPAVPHLLSSSCASPRTCGWGFLQTSPRNDALALLLAFGAAHPWHGDFHPVSSVPCLAHTFDMSRSHRPAGGCGSMEGLERNLFTWHGCYFSMAIMCA
jgi:hypothetical protein